MGFLSANEWVSNSCAAFLGSSACLVFPSYDVLVFILLLSPRSLDRKRVGLDWRGSREELGGADTGKTVMKICEKKNLFSIKGNTTATNHRSASSETPRCIALVTKSIYHSHEALRKQMQVPGSF